MYRNLKRSPRFVSLYPRMHVKNIYIYIYIDDKFFNTLKRKSGAETRRSVSTLVITHCRLNFMQERTIAFPESLI